MSFILGFIIGGSLGILLMALVIGGGKDEQRKLKRNDEKEK